MPTITSSNTELRDHLLKEFERYTEFCGAALDSNTFTEDALLEIKIANEDFKTKLENLNTDILPTDFDNCCEVLEKLKEGDDWDSEKIIELLDEDDIIAEAERTPGYAVIKLSSIAETDKLVEFVNKEIYPYNIGGKSAFTLD